MAKTITAAPLGEICDRTDGGGPALELLRSVQCLRALAALAVLFYHAGFGYLGAAGVDLFFVISGFIITKVGVGRDPRSFLAARFERVYPIFWINSLPWIAMMWAAGSLTLPVLASSITLWPVYDVYTRPALDIGWTLTYEILFYGAFALGLATNFRVPLTIFVAAFLFDLVIGSPLTGFLGNVLILEFLFGVAIALVPLRINGWVLALAATIFALSGEYQWAFEQPFERVIYWGLPSAVLLTFLLQREHWFASSHWNVAVWLGAASYSIYLVHRFFIHVHLPWWIALMAGILFYQVIEKPLVGFFAKRRASRVAERQHDATLSAPG